MKKTRVFLDSSVLISGLASVSGNSHRILALVELGIITACISADVQNEVLRNVKRKLPEATTHFERLLKEIPFKMVEASREATERAESIINKHVTPIMAAAISGKVDWLLSPDKHFLAVKGSDGLDFTIASPDEFLQQLVSILKKPE
jgi:predicted nucleic acid-binding protein